MSISTIGTDGITGLGYGFKNRIINGAMMIDQRNAGASVTPAQDAYMVDRWKWGQSQASKFTAQQTTSAPTGFSNSLKMTVAAAVTVGASDYFTVYQPIEGLNAVDLAWGTASAATVTLSFWVNCSLTGTFGGSVRNSAGNRSYPFSYTINSVNTWEQKTITITGDQSGTWLTSNGVGIYLQFGLGVGSTLSGTAGAWAGANYLSTTGATSVVGTNAATWYVTGVQLETGVAATSFDYRPYGKELALCQRYYNQLGGANGTLYMSGYNNITGIFSYPQMRAIPTAAIVGTWTFTNTTGVSIAASSASSISINATGTAVANTTFSTAGSASNYVTLAAEL